MADRLRLHAALKTLGRPLFSERRVQSLNRSMLGRDRLAYRESGRSRALNQALNATLGEQLLAHNRAPASPFPQSATGPWVSLFG